MGVWIETEAVSYVTKLGDVTPYVGVWIETNRQENRGTPKQVTPYVGVWIETKTLKPIYIVLPRHSLCGSVD